MKPRAFDPLRLDVAAFAAAGATLSGDWPADTLVRWQTSQTPPQDAACAPVAWHVQGEQVPVRGGEPEIWLQVQAQARQWLTCQRCLQPYEEAVTLERRLRFVRGEAQAEALDAELEDDVLALSRSLDLRELVEDELLLALPLVPRHVECPQPLALAGVADDGLPADPSQVPEAAGRPNPFAALAALRRGDATEVPPADAEAGDVPPGPPGGKPVR